MKVNNMNVKTSTEHHIKTQLHLWFIGVFYILVYSIGVYDYFMVHLNNIDYLNSLNVKGDVIAYFANYPLTFTILWAINVFSGPIAATLLLFRNKWAVYVGFTTAISLLCLDVMTFAFRNRWGVFGPRSSITDIIVLLITCGFFFYCRAMGKRGVLK